MFELEWLVGTMIGASIAMPFIYCVNQNIQTTLNIFALTISTAFVVDIFFDVSKLWSLFNWIILNF